MRTTVVLDDGLLADARDLARVDGSTSELLRVALGALIERESARRLALLGGSQPDLVVPGRRRPA